MPIYEFYCSKCHVVFNFFSRKIDTQSSPDCPRCRKKKLERQVSRFAMTGRAKGDDEGAADLPVDEHKMEQALSSLAGEAESINEDDPRQAAQLMRKFSKMTGMEFGGGMEEALKRLEAGEDPESIEAEMGDLMEGEEPFVMGGGKSGKQRRGAPARDNTLYEL